MKLLSPKTQVSRPITDRVKESLFSVLLKYDLPKGKIVADLFSGVGSLGLESLSRGAEFVTFVEKDPKIIQTLKKNIAKADFVEKSKVIKTNIYSVGAAALSNEHNYDGVFVDPPYPTTRDVGANSLLGRLLTGLGEQLAPTAIVIVRTHVATDLLEAYGKLEIIERRPWGSMKVNILKLADRSVW